MSHSFWMRPVVCTALVMATSLLGKEAAAQQVCAALVPQSAGLVYVVSQSGGRDAVACSGNTEATPFATIPRALQCAVAGDTILVKSGVYDRFQVNGKIGSAAAWLSIKSYPGHTPVIDGRNSVSNYAGIVEVNQSRYVLVSGLEIMHTGAFDPGGNGIRVDSSSAVVLERNKVHEIWQTGIVMQNSSDLRLQSNEVFNTSMRNENGKSTTGWSGGTSTHGGYPSRCVSWHDNDIHNVWGECIDPVNVDTGVIKGNVVRDCFSVYIYLDSSKNYLVEGNTTSPTNPAYFRNGTPGAGVQLAKERPAGNAASNITIVNNIIDGTGIRYWSGEDKSSADLYGGILIAHNFVRVSSGFAIAFDAPNADTVQPNEVANNIVYGPIQFRTADAENGVTRKVAWTVAHNLLVGAGTLPPGSVANLINVSPLLVGPTAGSPATYKLKAGSPAIASGKALSAARVSLDFFGVARSAQLPSIGIDEHVSAAAAPDAGVASGPDANVATPADAGEPGLDVAAHADAGEPGLDAAAQVVVEVIPPLQTNDTVVGGIDEGGGSSASAEQDDPVPSRSEDSPRAPRFGCSAGGSGGEFGLLLSALCALLVRSPRRSTLRRG